MSRNGHLPPPPPTAQSPNFTLLSILSEGKLIGPKNMDQIRNLKMNPCYENRQYVLDTLIHEIDMETTTPEEIYANAKHVDGAIKVACIMIVTMASYL